MPEYALAADLGGTLIRVALVDRDGHLSQRHEIPTLAHLGRDDVLDRFVAALEQVASRADSSSLVALGYRWPAQPTPKRGRCTTLRTFPAGTVCP